MLDADWFIERLDERHLSQRGLARALGVDHASVYRLLKGKRPMRMQEASQIARLLGVDVSEVLAHAGVRVGPAGDRTVPLFGWVDGTGEVHALPLDEERVAAPSELPEDAMAVRIQAGDGAFLPIDGWVYFCRAPAPPTAEALNAYAVARIRNGVTLLRFVRRGYRAGRYNLFSPMAAVSVENAELEWVAPVLLIRPA